MWGGGRSPTVNTSDQPRRLMLPQEVKEMGPNRMILFYEGLRPVFGGRIYYYRDKFFAKRELPPPPVPKLDIAAVKRVPLPPVDRGEGAANAIEPRPSSTPKVRPVAAADVPFLDKLGLEDFSLNFEDIEIPKGRPLTDTEIKDAVDGFLATLAE
jgi:type IV secretion system protein VirD4